MVIQSYSIPSLDSNYPSTCPSGAETRLDIEIRLWIQETLRAFILSVSKLIFMHSEKYLHNFFYYKYTFISVLIELSLSNII